MDESLHPSQQNNRLWMVGLRFVDESGRLVRHYYLVTAASPDQALDAGRLKFCSPEERDVRKGAPRHGTWSEISEIVTDCVGSRHVMTEAVHAEGRDQHDVGPGQSALPAFIEDNPLRERVAPFAL